MARPRRGRLGAAEESDASHAHYTSWCGDTMQIEITSAKPAE